MAIVRSEDGRFYNIEDAVLARHEVKEKGPAAPADTGTAKGPVVVAAAPPGLGGGAPPGLAVAPPPGAPMAPPLGVTIVTPPGTTPDGVPDDQQAAAWTSWSNYVPWNNYTPWSNYVPWNNFVPWRNGF